MSIPKKEIYNLIIIGSGPAGLTAAVYAARAQLSPLVISGPHPGGQLMGTTAVENWPGEQSILGPDLMDKMRIHAKQFGTTFSDRTIAKVDFKNQLFRLWTDQQQELLARSVIIATGAVPKKLNCRGEAEYWGKGVTTCAICDGALYKDQPVVVVGGGDTAMEDASFMLRFTKQITIIQNLDKLSASQAMKSRVLNQPNINIIYNSTVSQITGDGQHVTAVTITNQNDQSQLEIPTAAVFIAIGLTPNTELFRDQLTCDRWGYLTLQEHTKTSLLGIFAAGDVADYRYRQAITSAGAGCMAALDAEKYLSSL